VANSTITRPIAAQSDRSFMQRNAEGAIARHPFKLELRGAPRSLAWPMICANCGESASEQITVRKAFRRPRRTSRRSRGITRFSFVAAPVPFCAGCATLHRQSLQPSSFVANMLSVLLTPLIIPIAGSAYFGVIALRSALGASPNEENAIYIWGVPALMLFICVWSIVLAWRMTQRDRLEPQTDVTLACDFSDDVGQFFEQQRRIYSIRNERFARALADANRDRVWTAADDATSRKRQTVGLVAVGIIGAAVWLWVVFAP
jgi:hypothetical protein